jgi:hypothetical protein
MSISTIKRYNVTTGKPDGRGQYVLIKDIKQFLPEDLQVFEPEAEVYIYLMDNKRTEVIALKKEFDAKRNKITKPRKFNVTLTAQIDSHGGCDFDWHRNHGSAFFDDDVLDKPQRIMEEIEDKVNTELTNLIKPYKAKLKKLYSGMKPALVLSEEELGSLAYHVFEYNFDADTGQRLMLYPTKKKTKKTK